MDSLPSGVMRINQERYRQGDWVADLSHCYFYAVKHELTAAQMEEHRRAYLSTQGIRTNIAALREALQDEVESDEANAEAADNRAECVYLALMLPKLALKSTAQGFYTTTSDAHHFSLYYGGVDVSYGELRRIKFYCEEAFNLWVQYRDSPRERPYAFVNDFFKGIIDDELGIRSKICYLSDEQIENLKATDCIPVTPDKVIAAGDISLARARELRRIRERDLRRRDFFCDMERQIPATDSSDAVINIKIRGGLVQGEMRCLLSYLHDVLFFKCGVWYRGAIDQIALLGPTCWHISRQDDGMARPSAVFIEESI